MESDDGSLFYFGGEGESDGKKRTMSLLFCCVRTTMK